MFLAVAVLIDVLICFAFLGTKMAPDRIFEGCAVGEFGRVVRCVSCVVSCRAGRRDRGEGEVVGERGV